VKIVSITDVRQDATAIIRHAQETAEPVLVVQRSRPAAYVVEAGQFDAMREELRTLRHAQLLRDVAESESEIARGDYQASDSADALIASWAEPTRPRRARIARRP
jgi:antitoxin StbD